jgi:hypothetical protein
MGYAFLRAILVDRAAELVKELRTSSATSCGLNRYQRPVRTAVSLPDAISRRIVR